MNEKIKIELTIAEWEILRDGVADVACWHMGFKSALSDYQEPPQLRELINLLTDLKFRILNEEAKSKII